MNTLKKRAALVSILSNAFLSGIKFLFGLISGSISLISEALHSFGDLIASLIAFYSVIQSDKPADTNHQFGHGKFEDMAGFIEAFLIVLSACFIIYVGFEKIISKPSSYVFKADIAFCVMVFSVIVNYFVARYLIKTGNKTDSSAIEGDGYHLMTDVYSSFGIAIGLLAVKFTGIYILDPIIAILTAAMILKTGFSLMAKTGGNLLDSSLPNENIEIINSVLDNYKSSNLKVKSIQTSKSGSTKNIVLVIYLPCNLTLKETHKICDDIEQKIELGLKNTHVVIHAEPDCNCEKKSVCAKF